MASLRVKFHGCFHLNDKECSQMTQLNLAAEKIYAAILPQDWFHYIVESKLGTSSLELS